MISNSLGIYLSSYLSLVITLFIEFNKSKIFIAFSLSLICFKWKKFINFAK